MLSIFDKGRFAPCPAPFNLAAHVLQKAESQPDKIALSVLDLTRAERWSYERLKSAVLGTGRGLREAGFKPGDKLLFRLGNTVDFPVAYLGAIAAGLVPVPTSPQLTAREVQAILDSLKPAGVLHDPKVEMVDSCFPSVVPLTDLRSMTSLPPAEIDMGDPNRLCYVIYTSGTSGKPRAVAHAHRAIWARQMMMQGWYGLREEDRLCHAGGFNWTFTLGTGLMDPWTMGATALIPAPDVSIDQIPLLLKRHEASIFAAAPGVYRKLLQSDQPLHLPSLRHGLVAGEKLPDTVRSSWNDATGTHLYEAFGMSECSTFISGSPTSPARQGTLGHPQPGRRIAILGDNGPVMRGEDGIIAVSRDDPGVMLEYLGAPEETAARFSNGWFLTGDRGSMDSDGHITYLGRNDDMMNAGGFRVSPLEVETAIADHPHIDEVAAAEIEIRPNVRIVAAFYTGPQALDETELKDYASGRLARYKQPRLYIHIETLPRGANNKVLRRKLREDYEATHGKT